MVNAHKKLFVFDWNGTLLADTVPSWKAGNEALKFYGAKPISLKLHRETFTFPILPFYERHGVSAETVLERKEEGNTAFQEAYARFSKHCRTRSGAHDLLQYLNDMGYDCIILSNFVTEKIQMHLQRLKMEHYFEHVSAHDCNGTTILQNTTKVLRLKNYIEEQGYSTKNTVIIGDTMEEPEIAQELGLQSIGITDGYISRKRLIAAKPDYIIERLDAIKTLGLFKS